MEHGALEGSEACAHAGVDRGVRCRHHEIGPVGPATVCVHSPDGLRPASTTRNSTRCSFTACCA